MNVDDNELAEIFAVFPRAAITQDNVAIYAGRRRRQLMVNRCQSCRTFHQPPRSFCPACHSGRVEAEQVSGAATVHLFTRVFRGPQAPGVDYEQGHPIAVVDLAEQPGVRIAGQFVTDTGRDARLGETVELVWLDRDGEPVPGFTPTTEGGVARVV